MLTALVARWECFHATCKTVAESDDAMEQLAFMKHADAWLHKFREEVLSHKEDEAARILLCEAIDDMRANLVKLFNAENLL